MKLFVVTTALLLAAVHCRADEGLIPSAELEKAGIARAVSELKAELERSKAQLDAATTGYAALQPPAAADAEEDIDEVNGVDVRARIVNGTLTTRYPSVGAVLYVENGKAGSWCTGTLIGCHTFLTAQHCVEDDPSPSKYRVFFQHAGLFKVSSIARYSPYDFPSGDLAILKLEKDVEGIRPSPVHDGGAIADGTEGKIVGFGRTGGLRQDYGLKRVGTVKTASCTADDPDCVCWNFEAPVGAPGEDSNTCNADSGGPLLIRPPSGTARRVGGITSGGTRKPCLAGDHAYDADVRRFASWIRAEADSDLGQTSCGSVPNVGASKVKYFGRIVELAAGESKDYPLTVPAGIARLRIAMNGEDRESAAGMTNFNLYVRQGGVPTPAESECKQADKSQLGFCEFIDPQPGVWNIRVEEAGSIKGTAQLVATLFKP